MTYSFPSLIAVVFPAAASLPASASVSANAAKPFPFSRVIYLAKYFFCSSFPASSTGFNARELAARLVAKPASVFAISSHTANIV